LRSTARFTPPSQSFSNLNTNAFANFMGTAASTPTPTPTATATPTPAVVQFSASSFSANEGAGHIQIIVTRSGDTAQPATVDYETTDGTANDRDDYTTAIGRLHFAAGDTAESFNVFITDGVFAEGNETIKLTLSNASSGADQRCCNGRPDYRR
jgi:Calx-beta domain